MIKIKTLLPTLKEKKRYLLYETKNKLTTKMIRQIIKNFIGEFGIAEGGIMFLKHKNNRGVIRCTTKYVNKVKSALTLSKQRIKIIKVSGLIKKLGRI